jgi:hypothetical protein
MVQTCSKCSRANPGDAVYCYYDGLVLGGHSRNGGPVAVAAQAFASPFVFPTGKTCRSFNELALACQDDWSTASDLLHQGYLESFLGGLGRIDLVMAAKEASRFPDRDRGLDQFLSKLPSDALDAPKLAVETQEVNLGVLAVGATGLKFNLHLENKGMRLLYGSVTCTDGLWISFGDGPAATEKRFQFGHDLVLPVRVVGDRLRAANKPLEAHLAVESNGGSATVTVRAQVPVRPFPNGVLAGATTPRKIAEKAKASPKEAGALFESGEVAAWYKANGWTYPVQGPAASGMAAVQQFFEALGLTPPPKVHISVKSIALTGNPGDPLRYTIEVKTEEKKPIFAHGMSNQPWLEVGRTKITGRRATVPLSVPSVPNKPGQKLAASVTVQSNGNQRFVVPVTLDVAGGNVFDFDAPPPVAVEEPEIMEVEAVEAVEVTPPPPVAPAPARPPSTPRIQAAPPPPPPLYTPSYRRQLSKPLWVHLLPAGLLGLALLVVVVADLLTRAAPPPTSAPPDNPPGITGDPESWKFTNLKDGDPKLGLRFNDAKRFGLVMLGVKDPRPEYPGKYKQLTYDEVGGTNNTIVNIEGYEFYFGEKQGDNRLIKNTELPKGRFGNISVMDYPHEKVKVKQHVEIVPGQSGLLDTCLVWYHIENYGESPIPVGLRFMLDTYIGANDGVPFTAPGVKGFIKDMKEFKDIEIPPYLEVVERPDDAKDPGTVVRLGLKNIRLPGLMHLEEPDVLRITHFPPQQGRQRWDVPMESIADNPPDSCVALYWPYDIKANKVANMAAGSSRDMAFTYGLSQLEISAGAKEALALSTPDAVPPESDFIVTAYLYNANAGDRVKLTLPSGLTFAKGETEEKAVEETGKRVKVEWKVHAGAAGTYPINAKSGAAETKPHDVVVKSTSIFG